MSRMSRPLKVVCAAIVLVVIYQMAITHYRYVQRARKDVTYAADSLHYRLATPSLLRRFPIVDPLEAGTYRHTTRVPGWNMNGPVICETWWIRYDSSSEERTVDRVIKVFLEERSADSLRDGSYRVHDDIVKVRTTSRDPAGGTLIEAKVRTTIDGWPMYDSLMRWLTSAPNDVDSEEVRADEQEESSSHWSL